MLHKHQLPKVKAMFNKLIGGKLFFRIDLADAYLHIKNDDESKQLLTINTHRRSFRYNRLIFEVRSVSDIFQRVIDSVIAGLKGASSYLDDIIFTGCTMKEHRHNPKALFKRVHACIFRVNI